MEKVAWFDTDKQEKKFLEEIDHNFEIDFFEKPLNEQTVEKAEGYNIVSVFVKSSVNQEVIDKLDADLIACRSTGVDHVDADYAARNSIMVSNVPAYGSATVAEHTFGLILDITRKIRESQKQVENNELNRREIRGNDIKGKKLGVLGTGAIGEQVIKIANGFGMDVIAYDPYPRDGLEHELGFMYVELEDLLEQSDIISIHCPLTDNNHHLISEDEFSKMDETYLINTSRGGLVDTEALLQALEDNKVAAAGLDVLEDDISKEEVVETDDIALTPHNAFNTVEALRKITETTVDNIEERENVVNTPWG
jgi:D-lactate dehydrogenase